MSCWRVLDLSGQPDGGQIAQLLVKPVFNPDSYILHLTDLSNIWSEELDLDGIVDRASQEQSPIEVSKQDTTQLAILLDNVKKSLGGSDNATCRITRTDDDGLVLHTTITLPEPLDSLAWKFPLEKRTSITLKNELILPLLVSSHFQHGRISGLISAITDKDKAITRLVDQYESSNLDLAAAFPSVGGLKAGRKGIKREQAAKYVPALQPFREAVWRQETGRLEDSEVTTLGLFQEALAQSTPHVPAQLKSEDREDSWWTAIPTRLSPPKPASKTKAKKPVPTAKLNKAVIESSEDETEDEFETHENFKTRNIPSKTAKAPGPASASAYNGQDWSDGESTEDEEALDAPPKSQSQNQSRTPHRPPSPEKSPTLEPSLPPKVSTSPAVKSKGKAFRIGGKAKNAATASSPSFQETLDATPAGGASPAKDPVPSSSQVEPQTDVTPRKARRPFKIGGKSKVTNQEGLQRAFSASPKANRMRMTQSPTAEPPSSPPSVKSMKQETPIEDINEETPEEKAKRKRAELKRKNEEAAKKQAQNKKKRRF